LGGEGRNRDDVKGQFQRIKMIKMCGCGQKEEEEEEWMNGGGEDGESVDVVESMG